MPKREPFRLFVGDLHTDGPTAITSPAKATNKVQEWLGETWQAVVKRTKSEARDKEFVLMLGGDLVDREGRLARLAAIELLQPLANISSGIYGVPGTDYHVGEDGEEDRSVYDQLGAKCKQVQTLAVSEKRLLWAHHGGALGVDGYAGLNNTAKKIFNLCRENEIKAPDLVVLHHLHKAPKDFGYYRGVKVAVCPCWQLPNSYAAKRVTFDIPTIGALAWWPARDKLEWWTYAIPEEIAWS